MTKEDYLKYLIHSFGLPDNTDKYSLYGFFQTFRSSHEELKKVFAPLPDGDKYLSRLLPVFDMNPNNSDGKTDMYFIVRHPQLITENDIVKMGYEYLSRLKTLEGIINHNELSGYLLSLNDVVIGTDNKYELATDGYNILYNVILDWIIDQMDFDHPIRILDEAYYSIACNPWLEHYLKWIEFDGKSFPDVFEPYFLLWKHGYNCYFMNDKLVLSVK